jgi:PTH1 family peptidyl-tRNA hydrolase
LKLIVGLGNPGYEYYLTPHNLGFMAADRLAEFCGVQIRRPEAQSLTAETQLERVDVVLAKPQLFMNLSGIRRRGSAGGHNGLKSVIGALATDDFVRVRMGVRPERPVKDRVSYVLGKIRKEDLETAAEMIDRSVEAVRTVLREGPEKAMNQFNRRTESQQA